MSSGGVGSSVCFWAYTAHPVRFSSEDEPSSVWINVSNPFGTLLNSSGVGHLLHVRKAVSMICNSLNLILPFEGWWFPVDDSVDVNSGVSVNSSVLGITLVIEWAR